MIMSDDPISDYGRWDYEQYLKEQARPVCNDCGEHIMGEYKWEFHGLYYCENCVQEHRSYTEDY